jgi:hypothetical protein
MVFVLRQHELALQARRVPYDELGMKPRQAHLPLRLLGKALAFLLEKAPDAVV